MRILKHDAFARIEIVRKSVRVFITTGCAFCGGAKPLESRRGYPDEYLLYRYGYWEDGKLQPQFEEKLFCCKSCHDNYYN